MIPAPTARAIRILHEFFLLVIAILFFTASSCLAQSKQTTQKIVVRPEETDEVLINPGMGFTTFQMFNGDNITPFHDVLNEADLREFERSSNAENNDHPLTSVAYFRIQWNFLEPAPGQYRWDFIDGLLNIAHKKKQTLMIRISPYRSDPDEPAQDVPAWYRKMVGPATVFATPKWLVDPEDPRYAKYFGALIRAFGERYDGHPDLESVDVSILGSAGEGGGTELLTDQTMRNLVDPYIESFKKTRLISLLHGKKHIEYMKQNALLPIGWRQDCLGDLGFWAAEQNGWTHMYDYYPETIAEYGMQDAWKKAPVSFEICGFFDTWNTHMGYTDTQVKYIIDQSLKWHQSTFNGKSSAIPQKWDPLINDWLKKMGYRFVLRRFSYPARVGRNGKLAFETWWENKGVAPCYKDFKLGIRLRNEKNSRIFVTNATVRDWLPGDIVYNDCLFPGRLPEGLYDLQIAIVDDRAVDERRGEIPGESHLPEPVIKLAIKGRLGDGWYTLGKLSVTGD